MDHLRLLRSLIVAAFVACLALETAPAVRADDAPMSLARFESMIDDAPGLEAASKEIVAEQKAVGVATAKSGLDYAFRNALGPRSDIVFNDTNFNTVRYAQAIDVQLPLLGTAIAQQNAITLARTDEADARITLAEDRRTRLYNLRDAYVLYWQYDAQQRLAEGYVRQFEAQLASARSLRRNGFWTESNELDFLESLSHFRTQARTLRSSRRLELAAVASALGTTIASFRPLEPALGAACSPARDVALRSAFDIDATLARIAAKTEQLTEQAKRVKGSSIEAHATGSLGNILDFPPRGGYDLTAGVDAELPAHARSEERSLRGELIAELQAEALLAQQRRAEIAATTEAAIDEFANAREDLAQAIRAEASKRENVREAKVRFRTLSTSGSGAFVDVQTTIAELFAAENTTAIDRGNVYLKANTLLQLAPDACS